MSKRWVMKLVVALVIVGATYAWQQYGGNLPASSVPPASPTASAPPSAQAERSLPDLAAPPAAPPRERAARANPSAPAPKTSARKAAPKRNDDAVIDEAYRNKRSDVMVESEGRVSRILPDDNEGSRHQRFILRLANGRTVLIAHNIDLAPRVPITEGNTVRFHGEYEWTDRGGVVHWTHHDPKRRHEGGWLELAGKRYE